MSCTATGRRLGLAALLVASTLLFASRGASAAPATAGGVQLLAQTPWVQNSGAFNLRVGLDPASPTTDRVEVRYFSQLINRTNFDSAAKGQVRGYATYSTAVALTRLPPDPAGGYDIDIPVNTPAPGGSLFAAFPTSHSGVFPVQVLLEDSSGRVEGTPLTTFLVYASATNNPLSVAVVVPFTSAPTIDSAGRITGPDPAEATRLNRLAALLNNDGTVHASLLTNPLTVTALEAGAANGSSTDRNTLENLNGVPQGGLIQVLPSTYSPVAPGDLVSAGLSSEADQQVRAGAADLHSTYGTAPSTDTWVANGPLDAATVNFLLSNHFNSLIVPNSALTTYDSPLTSATPTWLQFGYFRPKVMAADPQLTADFAVDESPVLAANQLLAELAMIQTEQPNVTRGVVAMPPQGWTVNPDFMATLLSGLSGDPLVQTVTSSGLFSSTPVSDVSRELANPYPNPGRAATDLQNAAKQIQTARRDLTGLASLLNDQATVATLGDQLLAAESENISPSTRSALLGAVTSEASKVTRKISLPGSTTITLTATKGSLPITILSASATHAKVKLVLTSQRLIFRPVPGLEGNCTVPTVSQETCTFSLTAQNTTLKVPVETRSSGVFPLTVELYSPDGMLQLAKNRDTVRSTAVSGVGLVLIVVAVVSLALWWGRDLRHGRRPGRMAPPPDTAGPDEVDLGDDPVVHDFFNSDPPQYDRSGRRTG